MNGQMMDREWEYMATNTGCEHTPSGSAELYTEISAVCTGDSDLKYLL